jgi:hypothetical protein
VILEIVIVDLRFAEKTAKSEGQKGRKASCGLEMEVRIPITQGRSSTRWQNPAE